VKSFFKSIPNQILFSVFILLSAAVGWAVTIPNTFTPGTTISSEQMNANFTALKTAVDALESKVNAVGSNAILPSRDGVSGYVLVGEDGNKVGNSSSFSSVGGAITSSRVALGSYRVTFAGLGKSGDALAGNTQISSLTGAVPQCLFTQDGSSGDLIYEIVCVNATASANLDASFSLSYVR